MSCSLLCVPGVHVNRRLAIVVVLCIAVTVGATACDPPETVYATGGTGQIIVHTQPDTPVSLYDARGRLVPTLELGTTGDPVPLDVRRTDRYGNLVMRYVEPGSGYVVKRVDGVGGVQGVTSTPVTVTGLLAKPPSSIYTSQTLNNGFGYLKTRDGTLLSYMVRLPGPPENGPYPTLVEYSGYDPANPYEWGGTTASTRIASLLGYATVGVNLRGSGCSGGSFQLWEDPVATDGYDAVETVAAQPWVKGHKVGLVGLSYPGNAALYAAATQPPSLAAIAVGGTYDDGFRNLLRPSGMVNNGFAKNWITDRYKDAQPAAAGWAKRRIREGDAVCDLNQQMREQNVDLTTRIDTNEYFPEILGLGDSFAPATFVNRIKVPTFLVATWHDEQVGGHVPTMLANFTGTDEKRFVLTNGGHAEMFAVPDVIAGWDEFLDLHVKREVPEAGLLRAVAPIIAQQVVGSEAPLTSLTFPADRFTGQTYAQALAAYQSEQPVKVLLENGAGTTGADPGLPEQAFTLDASAYPLPGTVASRWYLGADGSLTATAPTASDDSEGSFDSYVSDPSARPRRSVPDGKGTNAWAQFPAYAWTDPVAGKSLTYLSPPLTDDTTMVGSASVDLWLRSSAADTDLQATLAEVRPDGKEYLVQTGWLRASARKLDAARSTELQPLVTMRERDAAPLPAGEFTAMRLEIYPFAHVFRAGSKVRLIITAPGGDRLEWQFGTLPGTQDNDVARSVGRPSSIALPVVPRVSVPTGYPACPGLRGQPCRDYHAPAAAPEAPAPSDDLEAAPAP